MAYNLKINEKIYPSVEKILIPSEDDTGIELEFKVPNLGEIIIDSDETSQEILASDHNLDGFSKITKNPISSTYVGSEIARKSTETFNPNKTDYPKTISSGLFLTGDQIINPIPDEYIIPDGYNKFTSNKTGIDVTTLKTIDIEVPDPPISTPINKKITSVSSPSVSIPSGYYTSAGSVSVDKTNISAEYIKRNISILGVTGSFSNMIQYDTGTFTPPSNIIPTREYTSSSYTIEVDFVPKVFVVALKEYNYPVSTPSSANYVIQSFWCGGLYTYGSSSKTIYISSKKGYVANSSTCFKPVSDTSKIVFYSCGSNIDIDPKSFPIKSGVPYVWYAWG